MSASVLLAFMTVHRVHPRIVVMDRWESLCRVWEWNLRLWKNSRYS